MEIRSAMGRMSFWRWENFPPSGAGGERGARVSGCRVSKNPYLALFAAVAAGPAYGLGIEFTYHDPEVLARGNAGVASNTNASAVYYNPALLGAGEGSDLLLTGYVLDYKVDHTGPGGRFRLATSQAHFGPCR